MLNVSSNAEAGVSKAAASTCISTVTSLLSSLCRNSATITSQLLQPQSPHILDSVEKAAAAA